MMLSDAFMAIADPNRRHLLEELRRGPKTVNELAADCRCPARPFRNI
jgi:hypothetical protein